MYPFHVKTTEPVGDTHDHRRAHGRRRQEGLSSNLGPVLDLSRGGLRLLSKKALDGEHEVVLTTFDEEEEDLVVQATVAWVDKLGFRRFEVGLKFINVDTETADRLSSISTIHSLTYDDAG